MLRRSRTTAMSLLTDDVRAKRRLRAAQHGRSTATPVLTKTQGTSTGSGANQVRMLTAAAPGLLRATWSIVDLAPWDEALGLSLIHI